MFSSIFNSLTANSLQRLYLLILQKVSWEFRTTTPRRGPRLHPLPSLSLGIRMLGIGFPFSSICDISKGSFRSIPSPQPPRPWSGPSERLLFSPVALFPPLRFGLHVGSTGSGFAGTVLVRLSSSDASQRSSSSSWLHDAPPFMRAFPRGRHPCSKNQESPW